MAKGKKANIPTFMQGPSGNQLRRQNIRVKQKPLKSGLTSRRGS